MGAVMGSKNLKALVIKGTRNVSNFDDARVKELGKKGYDEIKAKGELRILDEAGDHAGLRMGQ